MPLIRKAFTVSGKVQGVFFRDYTVDLATKNHLTGWVRNNSETGDVEGEAQGQTQTVNEAFKQGLERGSNASKVKKVEFRDVDVKEGEKDFKKIGSV